MTRKYRLESKWRLAAIDFGISLAALTQRAGLPEDVFDSNNVWLSRAEYNRLWEAFEVEMQDPLVGLRMGQWVAADTYEPGVVAAYCSANLAHALESLVDYARFVSPVGIRIETSPYALDIIVGDDGKGIEGPTSLQGEISLLAGILYSTRRATRDPSITPIRLEISKAVPAPAPLQAYFGVEPVLGLGMSRMSVALQDVHRPFLTHKPLFWRFMAPALRAGMKSLPDLNGTVEVVQQCLVELLPLGRTQIGDVATELGVGVRTLQRRLAADDESFQSILRGTRQRLAKQYLLEGDLSVDQISSLLGFESANSLYRAFQKWTGTTPEAFREANRPL